MLASLISCRSEINKLLGLWIRTSHAGGDFLIAPMESWAEPPNPQQKSIASTVAQRHPIGVTCDEKMSGYVFYGFKC